MNRFTILALCLLCASTSIAQTEVEGEVSGTWDIEGSPYILVDTTIVPEDEELVIDPGVTVLFSDNYILQCDGLITAIGTEEDSIFFKGDAVNFDEQQCRIVLLSQQDTSRFAYCHFDSLENAISGDFHAVEVRNSLFFDNLYVPFRLYANWAVFDESDFITSRELTPFYFGSYGRNSGDYYLTNCRLLNGIDVYFYRARTAHAINCSSYYWRRNGDIASTVAIGDCENVVLRGNTDISLGMSNALHRRLQSQAIVENNKAKIISVNNNSLPGVVVRNNIIKDYLGVVVAHAEIYDNDIHQKAWMGTQGNAGERYHVSFYHNIVPYVELQWPTGYLEMTNNTIVRPRNSDDWREIIDVNHPLDRDTLILRNNIVTSMQYYDGFAVEGEWTHLEAGYNCFHGVRDVYEDREELFDGDIFENPQFTGGNPYEYQIQANSPCIDAGDPDSPEDPDGTRADIGYNFYDQENGMPPTIISNFHAYAGQGREFRYAAKSNDWDGELQFEFDGLPDWLQRDDQRIKRDYVEDSVIVSGVVPEDQEDFVFHVIAIDDQDREDTLSVRVMVYPYRVLTGIVRGTLDIEQSPFIVADTAWVPAGDSLVLPPGTVMYFDNREDSLTDRRYSVLIAEGLLKAIGTEEDSVYFFALDTSRTNKGLLFEDNDIGISEFQYCHFFKTSNGYSSRDCNIQVSHSLLNNNSTRVSGHNMRAIAEHNVGGSISVSGKATIRDNIETGFSFWLPDSIEFSNNECRSIWMWFGQPGIIDNGYITMHHNRVWGELHTIPYHDVGNDTIYIRNNQLIGGNETVELIGSNFIEFSNNLVIGGGEVALSISPSGRPTRILNNIFTNSLNGIKAYYPRDWPEFNRHNLRIENNLFYNIDTLIYIPFQMNHISGVSFNSIFGFSNLGNDTTFDARLQHINANGDSVDAHYNIYIDPKFANLDSLDFRLYADSPLINAGNPDSTFNDVDGSVNDIGLFGGPYGESYEYPTGVGENIEAVPDDFNITQAYPNPFNSFTGFEYSLPSGGNVKIIGYDVTGRQVFADDLGNLSAGSHRYAWKGADSKGVPLATGIYYLEVAFGEYKRVNRVVILR